MLIWIFAAVDTADTLAADVGDILLARTALGSGVTRWDLQAFKIPRRLQTQASDIHGEETRFLGSRHAVVRAGAAPLPRSSAEVTQGYERKRILEEFRLKRSDGELTREHGAYNIEKYIFRQVAHAGRFCAAHGGQ